MIYLYKGDNLDVLPKLKKEGVRPNIVYLDPPYGTKNGKLTYKDKITDQEWASNFQKRLELIVKIIDDNAIIYTSIGHEEIGYAKVTLDKVFGKNNCLAIAPRLTINTAKTTNTISRVNDFVLIYKKGNVSFKELALDDKSYRLKDQHFETRGKFQIRRLDYNSFHYQKTMDCEILFQNKKYYPGNQELFTNRSKGEISEFDWSWLWSKKRIEFAIKNDFIVAKNGFLYKKTYEKAQIIKDTNKNYLVKNYLRGKPITSLFYAQNYFSNSKKNDKFERAFSYPKSENLIEDLFLRPKFEKKVILDPYCGLGISGIVSWKNKMEAHLIQISEQLKENSNGKRELNLNDVFDLTKANLQNKIAKKDLKIFENMKT